MKKIVIMADGRGVRWANHMNIPKHFAVVHGERLIARTVRLLRKEAVTAEIIVTSHDKRYEFEGSRRYEPKNNHYEIDRFTEELIEDDICFFYGDTFYSEASVKDILSADVKDVIFFGNSDSIVAVKIKDSKLFREHVMRVKKLYLDGKIQKCAGWQVYRSVTGQDFEEPIDLKDRFIWVDEATTDINTPLDYEEIEKM